MKAADCLLSRRRHGRMAAREFESLYATNVDSLDSARGTLLTQGTHTMADSVPAGFIRVFGRPGSQPGAITG